MSPENTGETARRYPEAYEWNAKREREGRGRMKHATFLGILVAIGCWFLIVGILQRLYASVRPEETMTFGLFAAGALGAAFRQWWYNSGMKMVLSAQQMLVAIDTEHNTREIAEALRRSQTVKS